MSFDVLPEELHVLIARHVDDKDLPKLALVCSYLYRPARLATMWTTQGSDSAFRFSMLLMHKPALAPLIRALVVDRQAPAKNAESAEAGPSGGRGGAALVALFNGLVPGGTLTNRLTFDQAQWSNALTGAEAEAWLDDSFVELLHLRSAQEAEDQRLFDLALRLISQCTLLQRFFILAPPPSWGTTFARGVGDKALNQQRMLLHAVARLEQLCVFGIWDERQQPEHPAQPHTQTHIHLQDHAQVQLRFEAFRYLLETAPPRLRNVSFPLEGPMEMPHSLEGFPPQSPNVWTAEGQSSEEDSAELVPLPSRQIADTQLTLFRLTTWQYEQVVKALFHSVRRLTLDISTSPDSIPGPKEIGILFDERTLSGDRLEWFTVDIACMPEKHSPLALGLRPRWPLLCIVHDGGIFSVMGKGPLNETDRERFFTLKQNSTIEKLIVWKREGMENIVGSLEELVPDVEIVEV